ncbi:MAG TPA: acyltransferase domain-containing protein, partial [Thermoanaerobaculia bacterium]|nr:acyltransferase domain-containing protein [Thermoanaerobaculia bacterium]
LNGECDMALAGGVSVHLPSKAGYVHQQGGLLSPDGHCRSFDAQAAGTVFGSGVGAVVLRRLEDALAAGDRVRAVILGSAVNNDGSLKVGFAAPSEAGQAGVIAEALAVAGVEPDDIGYVEAHGSGTPIGDPIEIAALTRAFRERTERKGFCALGSIKSNVGHLEAASGAAGLLKTILSLENGLLPPSLHFETPNPRIDFAGSPFFVNTRPRVWERNGKPRLAGVSSFGLGGTNSHVVLQEAPEPAASGPSRPWQLLLLSAKTDSALRTMTRRLAGHLSEHPEEPLADVAFTSQVGRHAFQHRQAVLCRDAAEAIHCLETLDPNRVFASVEETRDRPVAFLLPGLGDHYTGMGRELYRTEPVFRDELDRCARLLAPHLGADLIELLYPGEDVPEPPRDGGVDLRRMLGRGGTAGDGGPLHRTLFAHPAVFALEYSLARLWMAWGVQPQALIGYSLGEYTAACLAGVLSLEDALALVTARARLIEELPEGGMLAVPLSEGELRSVLPEGLWLAAVNGAMDCVASGPLDGIRELERRLEAGGVVSRRLETSRAFHSGMMEPIVGALQEHLRQVRLLPPRIPFVSNVTGTWIQASEATDPGYWARHLCQTVLFEQGLGELLAHPDRLLLEVGPGQTLSGFARRHPRKAAGHAVHSSVRHRDHLQPDQALLLTTLSRLWLAGVRVDWSAFQKDERRRRVVLPGYPFERKRYWIEPRPLSLAPAAAASGLKLQDVADWFYAPTWKRLPPVDARQTRPARFLVFTDECGLGERLVRYLETGGHQVVTVWPGERFERRGRNGFSIRPEVRGDFSTLFGDLKREGLLPGSVLYLWTVTPGEGGEELEDRLLDLGFHSLLFLAQALGSCRQEEQVAVAVVANGLLEVDGEERIQPGKALLLGPCRVIPLEYAGISCRAVDIVWPAADAVDDARGQELVARLAMETAVAAPSGGVLAYRGGYRWARDFEPVRLGPAGDLTGEDAGLLRPRGVYLITGGLGGLGLLLAGHLARTLAARLVLVGRSSLPPREQWESWIELQGAAETTSRKLAKLLEIERLGGEVLVVSADVASSSEMWEAAACAVERFGPVDGIFHAAGVAGGGVIQLQTPEKASIALAPKLDGTRVLEGIVNALEPKFLLLFSSTLALLGGVGHVAYCAANAYLDALAQARRAEPGTWVVAVNWDRWSEVGMGAEGWEDDFEGISPSEGLDAIERLLAQPFLHQVAVSVRPFHAVLESTASAWGVDASQPVTPVSATAGHPRPDLQTLYVEPETDLQRRLAELWQELLGIRQIGSHDNFFELGGDSLRGIQLVILARRVGLHLTTAELFEHPTVAQLAGALTARAVAEAPPPMRAQVRISDDELGELEELMAAFDEVDEVEIEEREARPR